MKKEGKATTDYVLLCHTQKNETYYNINDFKISIMEDHTLSKFHTDIMQISNCRRLRSEGMEMSNVDVFCRKIQYSKSQHWWLHKIVNILENIKLKTLKAILWHGKYIFKSFK